MTVGVWPLVVGAYLLGSVPSAYLAAKRARGVDIRRYGSGNVGATNLIRLTSRRVALPVIIFDSVKGIIMVGVAWQLGLGVGEQTLIGLAAIIGHNWPVFLRFSGGRGVITTLGVAFVLPLSTGLVTWQVSFIVGIIYGVIALVTAHFKRLPLGVFIIVAIFPLTGWLLTQSVPLTAGYAAMFAIMALRRLTARQPITVTSISRKQILLNRFLYDRDLKDKATWISLVDAQQEQLGKFVSGKK